MEILLPEQEAGAFLTYLNHYTSTPASEHNCGNCGHYAQLDYLTEKYDPHCAVSSCECATALFNHKPPTRWTPIIKGEEK